MHTIFFIDHRVFRWTDSELRPGAGHAEKLLGKIVLETCFSGCKSALKQSIAKFLNNLLRLVRVLSSSSIIHSKFQLSHTRVKYLVLRISSFGQSFWHLVHTFWDVVEDALICFVLMWEKIKQTGLSCYCFISFVIAFPNTPKFTKTTRLSDPLLLSKRKWPFWWGPVGFYWGPTPFFSTLLFS